MRNCCMNKVIKYVIEIIVVAVVLLAAIYGITKINTSLTRSNQKEVLITFEAQDVEEALLQKVQIGDNITDNAKTTYLGKIVALSDPYPYTDSVENYETNAYVTAQVPNRYNKDITVSAMADVTDSAIMVGETELKVGYTIPIINEKYMLSSIITHLEIKE